MIAVDLLGFGESDKPKSIVSGDPEEPGSVFYCFDFWAQQIVDLILSIGSIKPPLQRGQCRQFHLIGNSIGGVVALNAARLLRENGHDLQQVILINCAQRTLDDRRLIEQPPLSRWFRPLLKQLIRQRGVTSTLFHLLARPAVIRQVLRQAYPSGENVDEQLISLLYRPTQEPGASESFRGFVNLFRDHLAPDLLERLSANEPRPIPVRMIWGMADSWEDYKEAKRWASSYTCIKELKLLPSLGHCPHDENPEQVNPILSEWIFKSPIPQQESAIR